MRISDWSSDVCSSDLLDHVALGDGDLELGRLADLDVVEAQVARGVRIHALDVRGVLAAAVDDDHLRGDRGAVVALVPGRGRDADAGTVVEHERRVDRKSTRLNSSH